MSSPGPLHDEAELTLLARIQRKVLWLSTWMVHHANAQSADGKRTIVADAEGGPVIEEIYERKPL